MIHRSRITRVYEPLRLTEIHKLSMSIHTKTRTEVNILLLLYHCFIQSIFIKLKVVCDYFFSKHHHKICLNYKTILFIRSVHAGPIFRLDASHSNVKFKKKYHSIYTVQQCFSTGVIQNHRTQRFYKSVARVL